MLHTAGLLTSSTSHIKIYNATTADIYMSDISIIEPLGLTCIHTSICTYIIFDNLRWRSLPNWILECWWFETSPLLGRRGTSQRICNLANSLSKSTFSTLSVRLPSKAIEYKETITLNKNQLYLKILTSTGILAHRAGRRPCFSIVSTNTWITVFGALSPYGREFILAAISAAWSGSVTQNLPLVVDI